MFPGCAEMARSLAGPDYACAQTEVARMCATTANAHAAQGLPCRLQAASAHMEHHFDATGGVPLLLAAALEAACALNEHGSGDNLSACLGPDPACWGAQACQPGGRACAAVPPVYHWPGAHCAVLVFQCPACGQHCFAWNTSTADTEHGEYICRRTKMLSVHIGAIVCEPQQWGARMLDAFNAKSIQRFAGMYVSRARTACTSASLPRFMPGPHVPFKCPAGGTTLSSA